MITTITKRKEPVIIGPPKVGKSTVSKKLANLLKCKYVSIDQNIDRIRETHFFDKTLENHLYHSKGIDSVLNYWKTFEIKALEVLFANNRDCIFDLGGGHTFFEDPVYKSRFLRILSSFENVILLLPSNNAQESLNHLTPKFKSIDEIYSLQILINNYFNEALTAKIVYNKNQTPEQTIDSIMFFLQIK